MIVGRQPDARALPFLLVHALVIALVGVMPAARRRGAFGAWLGDFYPLLIVTALYAEIGLVHRQHGHAHDLVVQGWEQALFGGQPSREWIRRQAFVPLSWVLHLGYLAYYPVVAGTPLALWLTGRRSAMRRVLTEMMVAFYVCYLVSLLFPVAGPRYVFAAADNPATRTLAAQTVARLLDALAAWGTAFPSSHVAVAAVAALGALREWRPLGWLLLPMVTLLAFGTVYGQFHYVVDVAAALVIAAVVTAAGVIARRG